MSSGGGLPLALVHRTYSVDVHDPARDVGKQLRRVQPPERLLRDEQRLPDHRGCVLHLLEALGRGRPQPHRGEGRLHRVRRPEMLPVLARELIERHHPLPVALEDAPDFSMTALRAPRLERPLLALGVLARRGVRNLGKETARRGLLRARQLVEHVEDAMVPTPLLCGLGEHRGQGAPDPEMPIADDQLWRPQPAPLSAPSIARLKASWQAEYELWKTRVVEDLDVARVGLVTGQRLGIALTLWAMLTALETGSSITLKLALALGIALAVIDGQAVHAASVRPLAAGLVTNALHVAAMGTWVGVVIALLVAWRVASVATLRWALAKRAGRVATSALLVSVGSGALLSFQHLTGTGDLAATAYGRVIVGKLATLIVALALAMAARGRGVGASERWWRGELAALVALLILAAALVSLPPPT